MEVVGSATTFISTLITTTGGVFAGTGIGIAGVFRSTDNAATWSHAGLTNRTVSCFAVRGGKLFAGTQLAGVFRTVDNGDHWDSLGVGLPANPHVFSLATNTNVLVATLNGPGATIYRSTDDGETWGSSISGLPAGALASPLVAEGETFFIGVITNSGGAGVYRSTNDGATWVEVNTGLPVPTAVLSLSVSSSGLYAGIAPHGVFRSTNHGDAWTATAFTTGNVDALAANGTNVVASAGLDGVFRSSNSGTTWNAANDGLSFKQVIVLAASGNGFLAGTASAGVWRLGL